MQGARLNSGFDLQTNKEYCEEKKWGLKPTVDLISLWNRKNCQEKRWGIDSMVELI